MNPLEKIKQKLMIKPTVEERQKIAVVIKGEKQTKKRVREEKEPESLIEIEIGEEKAEPDASIIDIDFGEEDEEEKKEPSKSLIQIVDEREKGFDREALLKKLAENKKTKVVTKPAVKIQQEEEKIVVEPPQQKKAKKVEKMKKLIIESDEEPEETPVDLIAGRVIDKGLMCCVTDKWADLVTGCNKCPDEEVMQKVNKIYISAKASDFAAQQLEFRSEEHTSELQSHSIGD
jgi:hypothetical protein